MKKLVLAAMAAVLSLASFNASAIENPNNVGDFNLNAFVGFVPGVGINVSGDYVLVNSWWKGHFTIGGMAGFSTRTEDYNGWGYKYEEKWSSTAVMARATYGLNITNKFEVHAGAASGIAFRSWKYEWHGNEAHGDDDTDLVFQGAGIVGCRFFVTDKLALSAEIIEGCELSQMNLGVSFKF